MNELIEILAYKIGEGLQASSLSYSTDEGNVFHRVVTVHESPDLSFINGLASTGLRGSAILNSEDLIGNFNQLLTANRHHIPLVVNTNARLVDQSKYSALNNYDHIHAIRRTGCFQLIATLPQEEVYLTLIAHRIAELSLIPGIVIADYEVNKNKTELPTEDLMIKYLGDPDDQIECPTPSQEMIFGRQRRRIPNWFSLDIPVMLGSHKDNEALSLENAASQKYFHEHLPDLIRQAFLEFEDVFGISLNPVTTSGKTSKYAVIALGGQVKELSEQIPKATKNTEIITLNQLHPFPAESFGKRTKGKKAITILENIGNSPGFSPFYQDVISELDRDAVNVYHGKYASDLHAGSLSLAIEHMVSGQSKTDYFLGLEFTKASSAYPKHQILLQEIEKQYPGIIDASLKSTDGKDQTTSTTSSRIPLSVRMYKDKGPNYSRLSRFYNDTAFFYEQGEHSELVADPFTAIPALPAVSASFFDQSDDRQLVPVFDTKKCTGCGDCFVHCPHSAIPPIVISVEQLLKTGAEIVSSRGTVITKLTPLIKNLGKVAAGLIPNTEITTVVDFLPNAFASLVEQMNLEGDKLATAQLEFNMVLAEIESLPVAITDHFFNTPNTLEPGSGELFSLAVDPNACTGCSICAQVCEAEALSMDTQDAANLEQIREGFGLWEQLPDTEGETINRLHHDQTYSSLSAMMLSRSYYTTMAGASHSIDDDPYKTLLHIITAAAESVVQPKIVSQINNIDELINSLSENVHHKLSSALPKENLDSLSKLLKSARGKKLSLDDVVHQMADQEHGKLFDSTELERKTGLVEALKTLKWALSEGPTGAGRARYGMLLAGAKSMDWAKHYPANNFTSPSIIHWNGSAPGQTLGIFHGHLRYLLDNIKLMRRAALEAKDKYDPLTDNLKIAALSWDDLTIEEKQLVPPILLIAERDDLNDAGWNSLNKLLAEKYPLKVFLMDCATSPKKSPIAALSQTNSGLFSTIGLKHAFVFQGGLANINHLVDGLLGGLDKIYPALFNLHVVKSEEHGSDHVDWIAYSTLAVNSRAFPALRYDPGEKSDFLSGAINLDGNKAMDEDWVQETVQLTGEKTIPYIITWADWAFTQIEWKNEFKPVEPAANKLLLPEYIQLGKQARINHKPVIMRADTKGLKYYSASELVVEMTETVLAYWKTFQEIGGLLTEFPLKLRAEITKELSAKYDEEADDLKRKFEKQLQDQQASQTEVLRQQLKAKLVTLASMAKNKTKA